MKTIWKFTLELKPQNLISMPVGSEILSAAGVSDVPVLWALCDKEAEKELRYFALFATGNPVPDAPADKKLVFIDTIRLREGSLVFHLFQLVDKL